jgi:acyl-CoA dehydrogenase
MSEPGGITRPRLAQLSNADLPFFFAEQHHELAAALLGAGPSIAHTEASAPPGERARALARALGRRHQLYRWLLPAPDSGRVDVRGLALVRELLAYVSPLADALFAVQGLGAHPVALAGSAAQRAEILPRVAAGECVMGFALTEPEAGSDVAALATRARQDGDGWVLDGVKTLISSVGVATHYLVFATVDPARGSRGITAFLVPADAPGLATRPLPLAIEHPIGELEFTGCRLGADALVGDPGAGFALAMTTLDTFRVSVGAAAVGMARCALDAALAHVASRRQFGAALAEQPTVQNYLADMATELDAARLLVWRAAWQCDRAAGSRPARTAVAMAKLYATEAAQRIIDTALQLHGGRGVVLGQVVENLYRAIRPLRIYEGTSEIQRLIIGRALCGTPRAGSGTPREGQEAQRDPR